MLQIMRACPSTTVMRPPGHGMNASTQIKYTQAKEACKIQLSSTATSRACPVFRRHDLRRVKMPARAICGSRGDGAMHSDMFNLLRTCDRWKEGQGICSIRRSLLPATPALAQAGCRIACSNDVAVRSGTSMSSKCFIADVGYL